MERKLLTILFVDLVDSTGLVTANDPEIVRRRVAGFFEHVRECIAAHGGTVGKYAGDAVMATFGIPQAHEDDAERAVRAGLGILSTLDELGLEARAGVEAGEVLVDADDPSFATGEAINVAVRLQQHAAPGQVLIGPRAQRLTLGRIQIEDAGPLALKGLEQPVWAWHAFAASSGERQLRSLEAPLVGRDEELELLQNTFRRAAQSRRAHLVTVFGEPGVGKSRLARDFLEGLEGATVLSGRCLPYGEGITYWSLAEMVKVAAGITDDDPVREAVGKLRACCEDDAVADLLALASGVLEAVEDERGQHEIAWAVREWAEQLAGPQPLVLVFEDIHWAEEPLLDVIEHLAESIRAAPLFLLCLARPELLEVRPGWGGGRLRAASIELEALSSSESEELVEALLAERELPPPRRALLLEKTEGNPLFLEETIRMLTETNGSDGGLERIPDTVQALIAARIDRLPTAGKRLLQRAAVVGRVFWEGALLHLSPGSEDVSGCLADLLQRDFLTAESRSSISGERAYRFKHVLIREVAYAGLAKSERAEQHESFAGWLHQRAGEELLEIRAYHLDQACSLHAELDGGPPLALAVETAAVLETAARRAHSREAYRTSRNLFLRAAELEPTLRRRYFGAKAALKLGDFPAVWAEMQDVRDAARADGDKKVLGKALTALAEVTLNQRADVQAATELVEQALVVLQSESDPPALFEALMTRAKAASWVADAASVEHYSQEALAVAKSADRKDFETAVTQSLASGYLVQLELEKAEPLVERALELAEESGSIYARAGALQTRAHLDRLHNRLDDAEAGLQTVYELLSDIGSASELTFAQIQLGWIAMRRADWTRAERYFREAIRILKPLGDRAHLCEAQRSLAEVLVEQDRIDEAERVALEARETVGREDRISVATTTMALGIVRAAQGRDDEAEQLLREARDALARSYYRAAELDALGALARFLRSRGRKDEAIAFEARRAELRDPLASTVQT